MSARRKAQSCEYAPSFAFLVPASARPRPKPTSAAGAGRDPRLGHPDGPAAPFHWRRAGNQLRRARDRWRDQVRVLWRRAVPRHVGLPDYWRPLRPRNTRHYFCNFTRDASFVSFRCTAACWGSFPFVAHCFRYCRANARLSGTTRGLAVALRRQYLHRQAWGVVLLLPQLLWSLGPDEQFYFFWPLVVFVNAPVAGRSRHAALSTPGEVVHPELMILARRRTAMSKSVEAHACRSRNPLPPSWRKNAKMDVLDVLQVHIDCDVTRL
jgi:hypothetical protein